MSALGPLHTCGGQHVANGLRGLSVSRDLDGIIVDLKAVRATWLVGCQCFHVEHGLTMTTYIKCAASSSVHFVPLDESLPRPDWLASQNKRGTRLAIRRDEKHSWRDVRCADMRNRHHSEGVHTGGRRSIGKKATLSVASYRMLAYLREGDCSSLRGETAPLPVLRQPTLLGMCHRLLERIAPALESMAVGTTHVLLRFVQSGKHEALTAAHIAAQFQRYLEHWAFLFLAMQRSHYTLSEKFCLYNLGTGKLFYSLTNRQTRACIMRMGQHGLKAGIQRSAPVRTHP